MQNSFNKCGGQVTGALDSFLIKNGNNIGFSNFPIPAGYISCVNDTCVECIHVYLADTKEWKLMCWKFTRSSPTWISI